MGQSIVGRIPSAGYLTVGNADTSAVKPSQVGSMSRELEESRARTDSSQA
jgi:hypothetical protein